MHAKHILIVIGLAFGVTFLVSAIGVPRASGAVPASGIPVRCLSDSFLAGDHLSTTFTCRAADGTAFPAGQQVPSGYYFMLTDLWVVPKDSWLASSQPGSGFAVQVFGNGMLPVAGPCDRTAYYSFTSPYFVLSSGQVITASIGSPAQYCAEYIAASGILATNVMYVPFVSR